MTHSTAELRAAIDKIMARHSARAADSQYDRSVCILAVAAARDELEAVPDEDDVVAYGQAVVSALASLSKTYHDPDGEFTSGKGVVGDVYRDVLALIEG